MHLLRTVKGKVARVGPIAILVATWLLVIAYAFPGYMNWDAGEQLWQGRRAQLGDWHPPLMAAYWHAFEAVFRGPLPMLLVQVTLFIGGVHAVLSRWLTPRRAALVTALVVLFPPVLTTMAVVWKDAQMAAFLIAGVVLATHAGKARRATGVVLLLLAVGVRDNAILAIPPLALLIAWSWLPGRRWRMLGVGVAITVSLFVGASAINHALTVHHEYPWYRSIAIHDLGGTICKERAMTDDEVRRALPGIALFPTKDLQQSICKRYDPRSYFALAFGEGDIFNWVPDEPEREARRAAWQRIVREHTGAYLEHRWAVMKEVLGLTPNQPWEPVCQTFQANLDHARHLHHEASASLLQKGAGAAFVRLSTTLLFRPWLYALLAIILLPYALWTRAWCIAALLSSGLLYEMGYFPAAAGADYRYSHWLVTTCCIGIVGVFIQRYRNVSRRVPGAS